MDVETPAQVDAQDDVGDDGALGDGEGSGPDLVASASGGTYACPRFVLNAYLWNGTGDGVLAELHALVAADLVEGACGVAVRVRHVVRLVSWP